MKKKSFQIALSAVSCALATVFMAIGLNVPMAFASGYLFASLALMLPLALDMRLGGFLAYAATVLLCLPFGGIQQFYKLVPFIAFFGLHPLVNYLQERMHINRWIALAVKAVWFVGAAELSWWLFDAAVEISLPYAWMNDWAYVLVAAAGAVFFVFYDWLMRRCQKLVNVYVARLSGGRGKKGPPPAQRRDDAEEIFGTEQSQTEEDKTDERR